jgi:hypothetical protein
MPVSGRPGPVPKLTGGSETLHERERDPVGEYGTARPGPFLMFGPPIALAGTLARRGEGPGQFIRQRTRESAPDCNCRFDTVSTKTAIHAGGDLASRSGREILK